MILPFNVCVLMTKMRNYSSIWTPFWTPFGPLLGPKWDGVMASMLCTLSRGIPIILYPIDRPSPEGSRDPIWGAPDHAPEVPSRGARWGADRGDQRFIISISDRDPDLGSPETGLKGLKGTPFGPIPNPFGDGMRP